MLTCSSTNQGIRFVDVVFPLAIPKLLTYAVPAHIICPLLPGNRVVVSLGKKKILTAIVIRYHQTTPSYPTKPILDVLGSQPILNVRQLEFFQWMATYYMCTLGEVYKAALPSGFSLTSESKIYLHPKFVVDLTNLSEQEQDFLKKLDKGKGISYQNLEKSLGHKLAYKLTKKLLQADMIILQEELQDKFSLKKEIQVSLQEDILKDSNLLQKLFQQLEKKDKQLAVLLQYMTYIGPTLSAVTPNYFVSKKRLLASNISVYALQTLLQHKIFVEKTVFVSRVTQTSPLPVKPIKLSPAQQAALAAINNHDKMTILLHGVTGSGKTVIYTLLIQETLQKGGQVLYLLPEIGVATQIVQRLNCQFQAIMGVYHSKCSANERLEVWNALLAGQLQLIVGTRSALFLPFPNLQLIILDEEHESAYKQWETAPRYHARDSALMLAHYHQARMVMGSATPSIETYAHAKKGKYGLVQLKQGFYQVPLPPLQVVNMRSEQLRKKVHGEFSVPLLQALQKTLIYNEQAIIFQNRRGYAPYLLCDACGWVPTCSQCSVSLTYHQYKDALVCHYCSTHAPFPVACLSCYATILRTKGFGTEKVEETLCQIFPDKRIARLDLETTRRKNSYQQIITDFESGYIDILVGTQMVTKGLDFGNVTLVGIVDMDSLLHFPDFRTNERCFQLVLQVSGRAGRREKQGLVILQTKNPAHPLLADLLARDYENMYQKELIERQKFRYPPYVRLIKITCQHSDAALAMVAARNLKTKIQTLLSLDYILGPQPPLVAKVKNSYRVDMWIKLENKSPHMLIDIKKSLLNFSHELVIIKSFRSVGITFDVDPL